MVPKGLKRAGVLVLVGVVSVLVLMVPISAPFGRLAVRVLPAGLHERSRASCTGMSAKPLSTI